MADVEKGEKENVAEVYEAYASSGMDDVMGFLNDSFGESIDSAFFGVDDEQEASADVLMLLFALLISKLGIVFTVNIDWSAYQAAFGWLESLSVFVPDVPDVSRHTVKTVTFVFMLLLQPACVARMHWLSHEHQGNAAFLIPNIAKVVRTKMEPITTVFSPLVIVLWVSFWITFICAISVNEHMTVGFATIFLGLPAAYFTIVNYFRYQTWDYVRLRFAAVVQPRQYENLCIKEGSFVLFIFVAAYAFAMNMILDFMSTWDSQTGTQNAFLVIAFLLYGGVPLYYLKNLMTNFSGDRSFRVYREQLVSPFVDKHMYMKLVLLVESLLFSMLILLGSNETDQLVGAFVVSLLFFGAALYSCPFEEDMENYSDIVARSCVCVTLFCSLLIQAHGGSGFDVILILVSVATTLWFLYTLDLKELVFKHFFLVLQLHAQSKASTYDLAKIKKLPTRTVMEIVKSPIQFHVLSAAQKIYFATERKEAFFAAGKRYKGLSDIGVSWLDLQQMGFSVDSLRKLGFTTDDLMKVDMQLDDMGDRSDILKMYTDVLAERTKTLGANHKSTLEALYNLGNLYKDMGEHNLGMEHLRRCLVLQKKEFGRSDNDTLKTQQCVAEYYLFLNKPSDALELLQPCMTARNEEVNSNGGEPTDESLDCMRALGAVQLKLGFANQALTTLETRYITVVRQTLLAKRRADHPCTLAARLEYATALAECGCYTSVPKLNLQAVMNRQKTIYGTDNVQTLDFMFQYAELLSKMGRSNESNALHMDCVSEKAATMGPYHTSTIKSKFALAGSLFELGRPLEVESLNLDDGLADQKVRLGVNHPSTILSQVKLGGLCVSTNKLPEALEYFQTCVAARTKALGKSHELTLGIQNNVATVYEFLSRWKEAKDLYEETLGLMEENCGKVHLATIALRLNYALLVQRMGDLEKSRGMYSDIQKDCETTYGKSHPRTLHAWDNLGALLMIEEKFQEALDIFEATMELKAEQYQESHPLMISGLENVAACKNRVGLATNNIQLRSDSFALSNRVVEIREKAIGPMHPETIKARVSMAIPLAEFGNLQDALNIVTLAIRHTSANSGSGCAAVQEYYSIVGYIYCLASRWDECLKYTNLAIAGTIKLNGEKHYTVKTLLQRKAQFLQLAGRNVEAAQVTAFAESIKGDAGGQGGGLVNAGGEEDSTTVSPMQQQLQSELQETFKGDAECMKLLQEMAALAQSGKADKAVKQLPTLLKAIETIQDGNNVLLSINLSALLLNGQKPQEACLLMQKVYPILKDNFRENLDLFVPGLDMMGKAYAYAGQVPAALPFLEEAITISRKRSTPGTPNPILESSEQLLVQLYGSLQQFDKAIQFYTEQFDFYKAALGEASEPAITAVNNRAQYYFTIKDFPKAKVDHLETVRLLTVLQGANHPETIQSIEAFKAMYQQHGQVW